MSSFDYMDLCRLCLVKDQVSIPIFEGDGDARQIFHKIAFCLPVKVEREDKLPKKICDACAYKVDMCYQFYNTTANAEKQLMQWLGEVGLEDKQGYEQEVMTSDMMKQEQTDNRINVTVMSNDEQSNNMEINMIDGMSLSLPIIINQGMPPVSMSSTDNLQSIQSVAGTSVQVVNRMQKDGEEIDTEEDENSEDECDVEDGMQVVKEESENTSGSRSMESTSYVNVSLSCNEAGPSGLQQQKLAEMAEMGIQQSEDNTKTGYSGLAPSYAYAKYATVEQIPITSIKSELISDVLTQNMEEEGSTQPSEDKPKLNVIKIKLLRVNCATKEPPPMIPLSLPPANPKNPPKVVKKSKPEPKQKEETKTSEEKSAPKSGKKYKCRICGKESWNFHQWERHYRLDHGKPKAEKCPQCDKIFYDDEKLARHVVKMHQEEKPFPCHICNKPFKTDKFLRIHLKQHNKRYSCEICGMSKVSPYDLRLHMMKHNKEYFAHCEYCQRGFYTKQSLQRHILTHTGERPFVCRICNASYASASYLNLHAKSHTEREKYKCNLCDYETYWKTSLKGHVKKHTGENRIKCEVCGKSVSSQSYLQVHMRIHTGEKPNICEVCGKCFSVRKYLIVHLRTHTGERPYECKVCHKRFTQHGSLNSHMKGHQNQMEKVEAIDFEALEEEFQD